MIRYAVICDNGHDFDAWFSGAEAFDAQLAAGEILCPVCGSAHVSKALMTPAVAPSRNKAAAATPADAEAALKLMRELKRHVVEHAENVGDRFAEEARKIHYAEREPTGIYGEATLEEASALIEEGIDFHPLPVLPEERN